MAKKAMIEKNIYRSNLAAKFAVKRRQLKSIVMDKTTSMEEKFNASLELSSLPRNSAPNRFRNRCLLTGRPRGFHRRFGLSRISFRSLANQGVITGVRKSSW